MVSAPNSRLSQVRGLGSMVTNDCCLKLNSVFLGYHDLVLLS